MPDSKGDDLQQRVLAFIDGGGDFESPEGRKLLLEAKELGYDLIKGPSDKRPKFIKEFEG